jgi:MFS family permease
LAERGFDTKTAVAVMSVLTGTGLLANLIGGALMNRERLGKLLGIGLFVLAVGLGLFPRISSMGQLHIYAIAIGLAGGIVTVIFFSAWSQIFGTANVGKILGAAQLLTILASASGPMFSAAVQVRFDTFAPLFYASAAASAFLAACAFLVPLPEFDHLADHGS